MSSPVYARCGSRSVNSWFNDNIVIVPPLTGLPAAEPLLPGSLPPLLPPPQAASTIAVAEARAATRRLILALPMSLLLGLGRARRPGPWPAPRGHRGAGISRL